MWTTKKGGVPLCVVYIVVNLLHTAQLEILGGLGMLGAFWVYGVVWVH